MTEVSGKRRKEPKVDDFSFPAFRAPELTDERLRAIHRAAKAYADANKSDPFAYSRMTLYMRRGLAEISMSPTKLET